MADPDEMLRIIAAYSSISDKIRALHAAGYPRAQIAKALGRHPTQVRNVIKNDEIRGRSPTPRQPAQIFEPGEPAHPPSGFSETAADFAGAPSLPAEPQRFNDVYHLHVGEDGLVRLPREILARFKLRAGHIVVAKDEGEVFALLSPLEGARRARAMIPQWRPGEPLWSDALIAERRREAAIEERDG